MTDRIRINKYLADHGICSRREADRLINEGRVKINGTAARTGQLVMDADEVFVDGQEINRDEKPAPVIIAFNKPCGVVCSSSRLDRAENIYDYIDYPVRLFPVGRLDKDTEGLLLLTNRGDISDSISRARNAHEKEYIVTCRDTVTESFIESISAGVVIDIPVKGGVQKNPLKLSKPDFGVMHVTTRPCSAVKIGDKSFSIVLTQGYNRQIRRMCEALGNKAVSIKRVRVMNVWLGSLPPGKWREVAGMELAGLENALHAGMQPDLSRY